MSTIAGSALDDDMAVLSHGRTLHGVGGRGTGIGGLEDVLLVLWDWVVSMWNKRPALGAEADVPGRRCRPCRRCDGWEMGGR